MAKWVFPLNAVLSLLIIAVLALIAADLLAHRLTTLFPRTVRQAPARPPAPAAAEELAAFAPILEKGLFGRATQGKLTPITPGGGTKAAPAISQGDLLLLGTALGSFRETFALVQKASSKEERVFRLGDTVFDLGPLVAVRKEAADLRVGGRTVTLTTPMGGSSGASPAPAAPGGQVVAGGLAAQTGAGSYVIDQRALNASLDNIGQAMTDARLLPSLKEGKVEGFRVSEVKPQGIFGTVGIRNGDVLLRINDFPIDSPEKAIQSFVTLKGQNRIKLDLVRDGQPTTFTYDIR